MRDLVATCRGDLPKTSMCPLVGCSKPSNILTVVDLPEPLGPSNPKTSPRRTSKSTLSTARALGRPQKSLKILVSPRTAMTTSFDGEWRIVDCGLAVTAGIFQSSVPGGTNGRLDQPHVSRSLVSAKP